jgi:cytochrome c oxidase cbb3-type subunit 3
MGGMGPKLARNPILKHEDLFWDTVLHGRGPMPAWGSALSPQDIADIHAWLATQ